MLNNFFISILLCYNNIKNPDLHTGHKTAAIMHSKPMKNIKMTFTIFQNGRARPDVYLIPEICRTLHISLYELFDMVDPLNITAGEQLMLRDYRMLTQGHQYSVRRLIESLTNVEISEKSPDLCPILKINRALAAGIGDPSEFEDNAETVYVYYSPEVNRADFIFKVNGDSMEPEYHSGDEVLVQRLSNTCDTISFLNGR